MTPWVTVPNFFPDPDDLSSEDWYHLNEGYCISDFVTKSSGRYYKKVRVSFGAANDREATFRLLGYLGFSRWWDRWEIDRSFFGKIFGRWKEKPRACSTS